MTAVLGPWIWVGILWLVRFTAKGGETRLDVGRFWLGLVGEDEAFVFVSMVARQLVKNPHGAPLVAVVILQEEFEWGQPTSCLQIMLALAASSGLCWVVSCDSGQTVAYTEDSISLDLVPV